MYRERHSLECVTNGRSIMSHTVDEQIEAILEAVELRDEWRQRMAELVTAEFGRPDPRELTRQRVRLARAYADGAFTDGEYETRLAEIDNRIRETTDVGLPTLEEAAALFKQVHELWREATPEERRKLISPLIERVYVDMETRRIGAITPVPAFRTLLEEATIRTNHSDVILLSLGDVERLDVWSWWRRGRVHLHDPVKLAAMVRRWGSIPITALTAKSSS